MNLDDIEAGILKNQTHLYGECGIRINRVYFDTKSEGRKAAFRVIIPKKLAGKRIQRQFPTVKKAVDHIEDWLKRRENTSATVTEASDFNHSLPRLRENGITIGELLDFYEKRFVPNDVRRRISEVQQSLLVVLDARNKKLSDHTRRKLNTMGDRIEKDFENCYIDEITAKGAYTWAITASVTKPKTKKENATAFNDRLWSGKTRKHHWAHLNRLIEYAISEKALKGNPLAELSPEMLKGIIEIETPTPEILDIAEASAILTITQRHCPSMLPCVVVSLFDGLRQHEAWQLKGSDFDFNEGTVHVSAKIAKTRNIRFVELSDASKAWLKICDIPNEGKLLPFDTKSAEGRWSTILRKAKVQKQNALRHTAASVMLVLHGDVFTKAQLGHAVNSSMLFNHYKQAMKKKQAQAIADLRPDVLKA